MSSESFAGWTRDNIAEVTRGSSSETHLLEFELLFVGFELLCIRHLPLLGSLLCEFGWPATLLRLKAELRWSLIVVNGIDVCAVRSHVSILGLALLKKLVAWLRAALQSSEGANDGQVRRCLLRGPLRWSILIGSGLSTAPF